ncbi:terpenoid synthase [Sistotremastrum niveocremeum HHB9708]|uniref:Terpene synthase n=1 Tax=Sistotremastrum niveocremeum HHB9708 TaxID=1314777 RepID=A0A164T715_9AGAM|nr:terpenoid synthase [Sistotremastrum niveocremeum HHB9708]
MSIASSDTYRIPEMLKNWPWPRRINPHFKGASSASAAWLEQFKPESPAVQKTFATDNSHGLLSSLAYPTVDPKTLRVACDFLAVLFIIDDSTDPETSSEVGSVVERIKDVFRSPLQVRQEDIVSEVTRQFWVRAKEISSTAQQERFIKSFSAYLDAVVVEARDRDIHHIPDFDEYLTVRRNTGAVRPSFWIAEGAAGVPEHVLEHETLATLTTCAVDIISISNDMLSYNREQSRGSLHNMVAIAMKRLDLSLQEAMDWTSTRHDALVSKFLNSLTEVPSWGKEIDARVTTYIDGLGYWVRANEAWSFEGPRYFGNDGAEIQRSRLVKLIPAGRVVLDEVD